MSKPQPDYLNDSELNIGDVKFALAKQTIFALVLIGLPAVIASVGRYFSIGFQPIMAVHLGIYIINILVYFSIAKLPIKAVSYYLLAILYFIALAGILTFAVQGAGLFILSAFCIMAAILLGKRIGIYCIVIAVATLAITSMLFTQEIITVKIDLNLYAQQFTSWFLAILAFTLFVTIVVNGSGNIENYLNQALTSLNNHSNKLEKLIKQRTKQMEQAVDKLDSVLNASTLVGLIATDENGIVTFFNPGAEQILGYSQEEVIGRQTPLLWHNEKEIDKRSQQLSQEFNQPISGFDVFVFKAKNNIDDIQQWSFLRKDGDVRQVTLAITPIRDQQQTITGYLGCAIDITEKHRVAKALEQSEIRLRTMVDNVPGITYRCAIDINWTMDYISNGIEDLLGYPASDFIHNKVRAYSSIIHPDDYAYVEKEIVQALHQKQAFSIEYRVIDKDGKIHWVGERGQGIYNSKGKIEWIDGVIVEVTELKNTLQQLEATKAIYRSIVDNIPNLVLRLTNDGRIEFINRSFNIAKKESLVDKNFIDFVSEPYKSLVKDAISSAIVEKKRQAVDAILQSTDDKKIWYQIKIGPIIEQDQVNGLTLVATNISHRVEAENKIKHIAMHDHLTGLPNRRAFAENLANHVALSARYGDSIALLFLDLDGFKPVNDTYGHDFGDQLLTQLAERLQGCIRHTDFVARIGGDEFAVIMPKITDISQIDTLANSIISQLSQPFVINEKQVQVGVSIGCCQYPAQANSIEALQKHADSALYLAKQRGKNCLAHYQA